jgi:hypothetical protein
MATSVGEPKPLQRVEKGMNPERLLRRVAPTGKVTVRLDTSQRDLFVRSAETPRDLAHALRKAPVRDGKLSVRVRRSELAALIAVAARAPVEGKREEREVASLLRYLESWEERFEDPAEELESEKQENEEPANEDRAR